MTTPPAKRLPLRWRRLSSAHLQARNALVQRVKELPFSWAGQDWSLSIELSEPVLSPDLGEDDARHEAIPGPASPGDEPARGELWRARCHWGGADFELVVSADAARAWLQALYPQVAIPRLPAGYTEAVVRAACEAACEAVDALGRGTLRLESLEPVPMHRAVADAVSSGPREGERSRDATTVDAGESSLQRHAMTLILRGARQSLRAHLVTDSLGLVLMAGGVAHCEPARNDLCADAMPVRLQACIGMTWLTQRQLRELAVGDLVLMEQTFVTPERELWLAQGNWGLRVHWGDAGMTVLSEWAQGGFTMPDSVYAPEGEESPQDLDSLPLCLTFDLGEREITLGELRQLQVGQGIDLGVPLGGPVQLRVQGVLVARGDLIEVDGRLGVAIVSLHGTPPPEASRREGRERRHESWNIDPDDPAGEDGAGAGAGHGLEPENAHGTDTSRATELPTDA